MLQQTTVRAVLPYYRRFLETFPTLRSLARARLPRVLAAWSGLGYYRRARHLHEAARLIVQNHRGRFPESRDEILALPGIGRYTAGAILSISFGRREPVLDGNVARVLSRLFLVRGARSGRAVANRLWRLAAEIVQSTSSPGDLNQALMELGATRCTPQAPSCQDCPLEEICAARAAGLERSIPPPRPRRAPVMVHQSIALVERRGRYLMRRRSKTGLLDDFWEFPSLPGAGRGARPGGGRGPKLRSLGRLATIRHSITYRRIVVEVHRARIVAEGADHACRWVRPDRILRLPVSSMVPKVLRAIGQDPGIGTGSKV
jgi:A/G-specific adenine glycosylase